LEGRGVLDGNRTIDLTMGTWILLGGGYAEEVGRRGRGDRILRMPVNMKGEKIAKGI